MLMRNILTFVSLQWCTHASIRRLRKPRKPILFTYNAGIPGNIIFKFKTLRILFFRQFLNVQHLYKLFLLTYSKYLLWNKPYASLVWRATILAYKIRFPRRRYVGIPIANITNKLHKYSGVKREVVETVQRYNCVICYTNRDQRMLNDAKEPFIRMVSVLWLPEFRVLLNISRLFPNYLPNAPSRRIPFDSFYALFSCLPNELTLQFNTRHMVLDLHRSHICDVRLWDVQTVIVRLQTCKRWVLCIICLEHL